MKELTVLSLFDGIACGRIALERAGIPVKRYIASEIEPNAIKVAMSNYPDIEQIGDVTKIDTTTLPEIDLLIGGSPCQGFSVMGKQQNFEDPRSRLFWEYVRILKATKPKYFLLENVKMKQEYSDIITNAVGVEPRIIEKRPNEIDERAIVGDWEMDCVEGKKKTKKTLLVLTERKSRREIIRPMRDQTSKSVIRVLDSLEREYGANFSKIFRTITVDNGSEFADCAGMEKSCRRKGNRTKIYYCHPYSSYERGSNENANKLIRRWFPKGTDFRKVTSKAIQKVEDWINNYPREILGFRTAESVFQEGVAALI